MEDTAEPAFRFFDLPPELRNRIYRFALVENASVRIERTGYARPPLLRTSRQIRAESLSIYYSENKFTVSMRAYDSTLSLNFTSSLPYLKGEGRSWHLQMRTGRHYQDDPNWTNLLTWLHRYHRNEVIVGICEPKRLLKRTEDRSDDHLVVSGMFAMVRVLYKSPWEQLRKILEMQRPTLNILDGRWGEGDGA
ncbi:hypothetical protein LTR85_006879 [Meristemomyces frigidus]|nr:hypothetical protein LTR85_006879 [Meristemomyces frigidus]